MCIISKYPSVLFRRALHKDGKGIRPRSPIVQAFCFAACGLLGARAGLTLVMIGSIFAFLPGGFLAGLGLHTGVASAFGVGIVFVIGCIGCVLSAISLQGIGQPSIDAGDDDRICPHLRPHVWYRIYHRSAAFSEVCQKSG